MAEVEVTGLDGEIVVAGARPFMTETVSMRPVPCGPSTNSVHSETSSLWALCSERSQGMGMRSAPPRPASPPWVGGEEPLSSPLVDEERAGVGSGNEVVALVTEMTRSSARKYGCKKRYRHLGSRTSSASRCIV